jgi:cysteinyl-tRNA synthetase
MPSAAGERVEMGEKKNKTDFALWKFSPVNEQRQMEWESPWGKGFPGWHIECSAMSQKVLGEHFDIHTGGIDHISVHHTNEIAQSVCAHDGHEFVNYWCHVNFLNDTTGKMSKSNDDFLRLQSLVSEGYSPSAYRYLLLTTNYRSELTYSLESLTSASNALNKLTKYLHEAAKINENIIDATKYRINDSYYSNFLEKICSDLNTSSALSIMWEMIGDKAPHTYSTILRMNKILGLDLTYINKEITINDLDDETRVKVEDLIQKRKIARESKDWATADTLREEIKSYGIEVID